MILKSCKSQASNRIRKSSVMLSASTTMLVVLVLRFAQNSIVSVHISQYRLSFHGASSPSAFPSSPSANILSTSRQRQNLTGLTFHLSIEQSPWSTRSHSLVHSQTDI